MNRPVRDRLGVQKAVCEIQQYEQNWLQHLTENGHKQDTQGVCAV